MYPLQFLKKGQVALRNVAGAKLFVISAIWAIVSTILPAVQLGYGLIYYLVITVNHLRQLQILFTLQF